MISVLLAKSRVLIREAILPGLPGLAQRSVIPACLISSYWIALSLAGALKLEHIYFGLLFFAGAASVGAANRFFQFALPGLLTAVVYDGMRLFTHVTNGSVHVAEPYLFDLRFFGIETVAGRLTPNEWWQLRTHPGLDLVSGIFYLTFIGIFVGIALYFRYGLSRRGNSRWTGEEIRAMAPRLMWAFFIVNVLGYITYFAYPAAPPWYVALYGLGPARSDVLPNPAGCLRFDALLGVNWFAQMYSRSSDVFGAIPSLHVAYPIQAFYFGMKFRSLRLFCAFFYLAMCFSAIYLNHHYVLDVVLGSLYGIVVAISTDSFWNAFSKARSP